MTQFNWAILGTSFISDVMATAISQNPNGNVYGIAGRSADALSAMTQKFSGSKAFTDFDQLINDNNVDIVYIALPNHIHVDWIIKAANAGKAIVCEKSLSIDMTSTQQALDCVKKHEVFFAEGLMYLHHPATEKLIQLVQDSELGALKKIQASYSAAISEFTNPHGKGAIYNLGCYPASLAATIANACSASEHNSLTIHSATGRRDKDGNIVESLGLFHTKDGQFVSLHCAEDYGLDARFVIHFERGIVECVTNPWLPGVTNQIRLSEYETQSAIIDINAQGDAFDYQVRGIHRALEQQDKSLPSPQATWQHSLNVMEILTSWEDNTSC